MVSSRSALDTPLADARRAHRPVGRQRLGEQVADALIDGIVDGTHAPGTKLPTEPELMARFGVSRTAIREALRILSTHGFVNVEHGKGARVTERSPQAISNLLHVQLRREQGTLHHVLEARRMLEMTAVALAARRAAAADLVVLEEALAAMGASTGASDYIAADLAYHRAIVQAAHNPVLLLLNDAIADLLAGMRERTYAIPGAVAQSLQDHRWVYEAIASGDADQARQRMAAVLDEVEHAVQLVEGAKPAG